MSSTVNYYELLGVEPTATTEEIKSAFRRQAMKYHPDRNQGNKQAEEQFKKINEAYDCLSNALKRDSYDEKLRREQSANTYHNAYRSNDFYGNSYQSTSEQHFEEDHPEQEETLREYLQEILYASERGRNNLRQHIQSLRLSNLAGNMPRLHYLILMVMGYALLQNEKGIFFFARDIKDEASCIRIIEKTFSLDEFSNCELIENIKKLIKVSAQRNGNAGGMKYTRSEWTAFGAELHSNDWDGVWAHNPFENAPSYNENYSSQTSSTPEDFEDWSSENEKDDEGAALKKIGCIFLVLVAVILCIAYWKYIVFGIVLLIILVVQGKR